MPILELHALRSDQSSKELKELSLSDFDRHLGKKLETRYRGLNADLSRQTPEITKLLSRSPFLTA